MQRIKSPIIIRLSNGQCELLEKDDFKTLKLRAPDGWQADEIQRELPFKATFGPGHVWVQEADLRTLYPSEPRAAQVALTLMFDKARAYGFYDDKANAVRIHIEYD